MNKRQQKLGVTREAYIEGVVENRFLDTDEAFKAKACQWRKGTHDVNHLLDTLIGDGLQTSMFPTIRWWQRRLFLENLSTLCEDLPKNFLMDWEKMQLTVA